MNRNPLSYTFFLISLLPIPLREKNLPPKGKQTYSLHFYNPNITGNSDNYCYSFCAMLFTVNWICIDHFINIVHFCYLLNMQVQPGKIPAYQFIHHLLFLSFLNSLHCLHLTGRNKLFLL